MKTGLNQAVIAVGSNISPAENVRQAREWIAADHRLVAASTFVRTQPEGFTEQEDFLNGAFHIETALDIQSLKKYLLDVESRLGRVRTENKNGPRTIDLDITVFNGQIVDEDFYRYDFVRNAVTELLPEFKDA